MSKTLRVNEATRVVNRGTCLRNRTMRYEAMQIRKLAWRAIDMRRKTMQRLTLAQPRTQMIPARQQRESARDLAAGEGGAGAGDSRETPGCPGFSLVDSRVDGGAIW